jgi:internalin A
MILVGRGGVGKTSLVNHLVHSRYDPQESKTDGISITPWTFAIRDEEIKLNIWDFGGQEIMHSTHQFFLTKRSLYLLVLNAREGEQDGNVEYWLRLIESFGGDSPVIVVTNKVKDHLLDLNRRGLKEKFATITQFVQTDCAAGIGLDELKAAIVRETDKLEHLRDPFPAAWFAVKERLANLRVHEEKDFIPFSRYQALCLQHGIEEAIGQETLVGFLHDLGIVVNFRDDPRLSEMHVLNPEWVTNGIYKILNADKLAQSKGELNLTDLPRILNRQFYPANMHLFLLDLMRKFELCYEFYGHEGHYLVPELLGKEEPDLSQWNQRDSLKFDYRYNILPEGLLPRFVVRSKALNRSQIRWRTGAVLEWEGNTAIVKADPQDRHVSIVVAGPTEGRRRLLAVVRADFEHIHASIPRLQARGEVPLIDHPGLAVDYQTLSVLEGSGETEHKVVHDGRVVTVNVRELLRGVDEARRTRDGPRSVERREAVRVAFSYSHKDEELRDQLETHLKLLQRQGLIASWHDRRIAPGDGWRDVIEETFLQSDLILLLLSADFLASDYCYETEMITALERHREGSTRVVPVVLRACDWTTAPFSGLQALPKDATPVTSWSNRDEAWNDVARGLRSLVDDIHNRRVSAGQS